MKIRADLFHRQHADRRRQQAVHRAAKIRRGGIGFSMLNAATCSSACTPASVRPGPGHLHRAAFDPAENLFQRALDGRQPGLDLPAVKPAAVVGEREFDAAHRISAGAEPGFTTGMPSAHMGHARDSAPPLACVASATRGTPTSACPPLAVDDGAGRQHVARPAARSTSMTSWVLPPVVMTSSITTAGLARRHREAAAQGHRLGGGVALREDETRAQSARHFVADDQSAQRRDATNRHRAARIPATVRPAAVPAFPPPPDAAGPARIADIRRYAGRW